MRNGLLRVGKKNLKKLTLFLEDVIAIFFPVCLSLKLEYHNLFVNLFKAKWQKIKNQTYWVALTEWIDAIIYYTPIRVQLIPNLPILSNKHELRSIVVNKGQFRRELG